MTDIIIYGRGKTGQSLKKMLQRQGKDAEFYDDATGFDRKRGFTKNSVVLLSPGVNPHAKGIAEAKKSGSRIVSELEYCFPLCKGKCISVTGTNGKTTTCQMIYHILTCDKKQCRLLGNGGVPFSAEVLDVKPSELVVLESSSFQLDNAIDFSPYISVFTNLACDHLDYHFSFQNYVSAKLNNFVNQRSGYAIFNADDGNVTELSSKCKCKKTYYSVAKDSANCYFDGVSVVINLDGDPIKTPTNAFRDYAEHNVSNALAAILTAYLLGISPERSLRYLHSFRLLPHRMENVATYRSVLFVDDSKATNVHATVSAIKNYTQPIALILGGSDKGEPFDEIFSNLGSNVTAIAASGDTANKIAECGKKYGANVAVFCDIEQAVYYCYDVMRNAGGGVVLMSNACASFDKFTGYAERGLYFKKVVEELIRGKKTY